MHELSIAQSLLGIVEDESKKHGASRVTRVCIRVGALSAIVPESLTFSFEVLSEKTIAEGAGLDIEIVPARGKCRACNIEFEVDGFLSFCPECGGVVGEIVSGKELEISHIEVE
jgi:hydrogenase nickel incorporation protein HypA/HybF